MRPHKLVAALLLVGASLAHADAVDTLRNFVRDVKSGRAAFTQVVTSTDGARKKTSSGEFEFLRPNLPSGAPDGHLELHADSVDDFGPVVKWN